MSADVIDPPKMKAGRPSSPKLVAAQPSAQVVQFSRASRSEDTIAILRDMLEWAERGDLSGIAVVGMLKQRKYVMHVTGEAHRNPTFTRGMLTVLDDELAFQIHGRR